MLSQLAKMGKTISQLDSAMLSTCNCSGCLTCQLDNQISIKTPSYGYLEAATEQMGQVYIFVSTSLKTIGLRCYLPC